MSRYHKIVLINIAVVLLYSIGASFLEGYEGRMIQTYVLGLFVIPSHVLICIIMAVVKKLSKKGTEEERRLQTRGYVFSAFTVLVIGFSACWVILSVCWLTK